MHHEKVDVVCLSKKKVKQTTNDTQQWRETKRNGLSRPRVQITIRKSMTPKSSISFAMANHKVRLQDTMASIESAIPP
jgi:hypothetical protein